MSKFISQFEYEDLLKQQVATLEQQLAEARAECVVLRHALELSMIHSNPTLKYNALREALDDTTQGQRVQAVLEAVEAWQNGPMAPCGERDRLRDNIRIAYAALQHPEREAVDLGIPPHLAVSEPQRSSGQELKDREATNDN